MYSPSHGQADVPVVHVFSTLGTVSDLCKNDSLAVLFGSDGTSYTVCTQSDNLHNTETLVRQKE